MADEAANQPASPTDGTPAPPPAAEGVAGQLSPPGEPKAAESTAGVLASVPRVISVIVLLVVVLLIGALFFRVMAAFLAPLFLAAVLAVVFKPLHAWTLGKLDQRQHLAALATTTIISLLVIVPTAVLGWMAYVETSRIVQVALVEGTPIESASKRPTSDAAVAVAAPPAAAGPDLSLAVDPAGAVDNQEGWAESLWSQVQPLTEWYRSHVNNDFEPSKLAEYAARNAVRLGLVGVQAVVSFLIGLAIMVFALYYFFADGPSIVTTLMHLSPLDDDYERELLVQFANVSRAVVLATVLSAIVQGVLAGIGYFFVLESWAPPSVAAEYASLGADRAAIPSDQMIQPPLFLLTVLTMLLAIVPFLGATAVWIPVVIWVWAVQGSAVGAIGMAIYGTAVVSSIDNVIKPLVLHGQSNLHPLLALLSVLGGLQLLGPIGILVGPMLVAFLQALLEMLRKELDVLQSEPSGAPAEAPA